MKQLEKIQKEISECTCSMEMAGLILTWNKSAIIYCKQNYPDEVCVTESGESEITIYGLQHFLDSEV